MDKAVFEITENTKIKEIIFSRSLNGTVRLWIENLLTERLGIERYRFSSLAEKTISQIAEDDNISDSDVQIFIQESNETIRSGV